MLLTSQLHVFCAVWSSAFLLQIKLFKKSAVFSLIANKVEAGQEIEELQIKLLISRLHVL